MKDVPCTYLVTVGVTCFNAENTISRALESVQKQNLKNIEILVVDDGSSDNSINVISKIKDKDHRIRLIKHNKNLGTGASRSCIVSEARGKFLAFLDDDDEMVPERLEKQIDAIIDSEKKYKTSLIACYCSRTVISDRKEEYMQAIGVSNGIPPYGPMVALNILSGFKEPGYGFGAVGSGTLMARRKTFLTVGEFDSNLRRTEDLDWAIRLSLIGGIFIGCREPLIRQHVTISHEKDSFKPLINSFTLLKKHKNYLKKKKTYRSCFIFQAAKFFYAKNKILQYKILIAILYITNKNLILNIKKG